MLSTTGVVRKVKTREERITSAHNTGEDATKTPHPDALKSWRRPGEAERHLRGMTDSYHLQSSAATSFLLLQIVKTRDTGLKSVTYRRCFKF